MSSHPDPAVARVETVRALVRALLLGRGVREIEPHIAPHHALHVDLPLFQPERGARGLRLFALLVGRAFSEVDLDVGEAVCDGRLVAMRLEARAKHTGTVGVIEPTQRTVRITALVQSRFSPQGEDLVETWVSFNFLGILEQLGVVRIREATLGPS